MRFLAPDHHEIGFWLRHVRIGVSLSVLTAIVGLAYVAISPAVSGSPVLIGMLVCVVAGSALIPLLPLQRMLSSPRGLLFFYAWSAAIFLFIFSAAMLDGGATSPVLLLSYLPLIYGAIAYPPVGVLGLGVLAIGLVAVAAVFTPAPGGYLLMLSGTLTLVTVMCAVTARNHWEQYATQALLARKLAHLAHHDGLTGCLNHRAFHEALGWEADRARRMHRPLALLAVDLDDFKVVNDLHGHPVGDQVLASIGRTLRDLTRDGDHVGRVGGDEFAILLPDTEPAEALRLAERVRTGVGQHTTPVHITVSIGLSAMPFPARDGEQLLEHADDAVYTAKRAGRDCVRMHGHDRNGGHAVGANTDERLRQRVLDIIGGNLIGAVFQPVVSLIDGSVVGYEALARIEGSHLGPDRWLDMASQVGLREELERLMWEAALKAGAPPDGRTLFLNATPGVIISGGLDEIRDRLPRHVAIEVSERYAIRDYAELTRHLDQWTERGVRVAVDDMGAGHANLHHVLNLAPHYLKLDRSLVAEVHLHPSRRALLESLLSFARRIDSRIIAEGVEGEDEAQALADAGVEYGQGRLFAGPAQPWPGVNWTPPHPAGVWPLAR
jgi:diguanylate cyclase (GGDEF)-like protein